MKIPVSSSYSKNQEDLIASFLPQRAEEPESIADKYAEELTQKSHELSASFEAVSKVNIEELKEISTYYTCPICGHRHILEDSHKEDVQIASKKVGTEIKGRAIIDKYVDTYATVRICKNCHERKEKSKQFINILCYGLIPLIYVISYLTKPNEGVLNLILILLVMALPMVFVKYVLLKILDSTIYEIDIDKAKKNNAVCIKNYNE